MLPEHVQADNAFDTARNYAATAFYSSSWRMTESWLKLVSYSKAYASIALKDFDCSKMLVSKTDVWFQKHFFSHDKLTPSV